MTYELSANVSILYPWHPFLERFALAAKAGFRSVETWWPFEDAVPSARQIDDFVDAIGEAGVRLTGLNLFAGNMQAGMRGVASYPARTVEFRDNVQVVAEIAQRTGCQQFNALYGSPLNELTASAQRETALQNLAFAAETLATVDGTILIEPLSGVEGYALRTSDDAARIVDDVTARARRGRVRMLFDVFHLSSNHDDLAEAAMRNILRIGHVQIADAPGRGEPASGSIGFDRVFEALRTAGYEGLVACEFTPADGLEPMFDWVDGLSEYVHLPGLHEA